MLQVIRLPGVHAVGPAGHIDGRVGQRLVHRDEGVPEPADALLVAEGLAEGLAQRDRGVLDGVMRLDLDIALGAHGEVEAGVAAQRCEHVVIERDAGVDVDLPGAVEVEFDDDLGFLGAAFDTRTPGCFPNFGSGHGAPKTWSRSASRGFAALAIAPTGLGVSSVAAIWALARRNASFSWANPVVARR